MMAEPTPQTATDALVAAARSDREALGRLYDVYYPQIYGYCLRRLHSRAAAEDVTADTFLRVARHMPSFLGRSVEDFQRWLYRIAVNEVNAAIRKTRRRMRHRERIGLHKASSEPSGQADGRSPYSSSWDALRRAIEGLSSREQTIVILRFYQGMSHEEIGRILDRRPGTVRVALSRAIAKLRRRLASTSPEGEPVSQREQPT